jgi:hypothetical protein
MASNDSPVERFKVSIRFRISCFRRVRISRWFFQVADDVAGVTLARQKKTIALSLQLDAARDIREQLKQCYRSHGMNHQDKCKVRSCAESIFNRFPHAVLSNSANNIHRHRYAC